MSSRETSSSSSGFGKVVVRNRRNEGNLRDLASVNFNRSPPVPPKPKMEQSVYAYTDERLQQGWDYAEKSLERHDITPRSAIFMNKYKEQISDAMNASANEDRVAYIRGVRVLEHLLNTEFFLKYSLSDKMKQLHKQILALREFQYFARYGDYLQGKNNQVPKLLLFEKDWTNLGRILSGTDPSDTDGQHRTNLLALIAEASYGLALDYRLVEFSILEYGKRNNAICRDLEYLKNFGAFDMLKQILSEDWKDIDLIFSEVRPKVDHNHLKRIIESEIDLGFDTYNGGYGDCNKWAPTDYLRSLELEKKPSGEAPPSPVVSSATQAMLERGESGIPITRKGKKRIASSQKLLASERATKKRIKLLGKKARLEERLKSIDDDMARIDQEAERGRSRWR